MPPKSKAQAGAMGAEIARRRAGKKAWKFKGMSLAQLEEYLGGSSLKGLPERKTKKVPHKKGKSKSRGKGKSTQVRRKGKGKRK